MFISIILLSALIQGLVALFVLQKNRKSLTNRLFFLLSVFLICWAVINFIITKDPYSASQLSLYRLLMTSVVVQNTFFFLFAHTYPMQRIEVRQRILQAYLIFSVITGLVALSPWLFTSVKYGAAGARPVGGPGMLLFIMQAAVSVISGLKAIYRRFAASSGVSRQQFKMIFYGSIILWGIVPITNFVISMATQTLFFARISPIYTLAFSSIIAYAIVAQKLFDIRAAVARSVAYVLLLAATVGIYGLFIFGVVDALVQDPYKRQLFSLLLVLPLAFSFHSFKLFFDRITNRIFFRDAYDPQEVIDSLGSILVAEIELHKILSGTRRVLAGAFNSSFIEFILIEQNKETFEVPQNKSLQENFETISRFLDEQHKDTLDVQTASRRTPLGQALSSAGVAISLRLKTQQQVVGYVLVGEKRSGDIYSDQDVKLLTIVAGELAVGIQNSLHFLEIQRFNVTLQEKVDEATKQLRSANHRLKELDQTKDEFISMASHQLRTPLTTIKGYLSMVLEGDVGPVTKDERKMIQQAFDGAEKMVFLIADLLNISRLQSGKFVIENKPTDLAKMVEGEVEQLKDTAEHHQLKLTFRKPEKFPILNLDETKIRQVLMNFLDNAIYYTPAGGSIEVALEATADTVSYTVTDTGLGVPKAEQHHLFAKFYRAGNARKMRPDGTGLGLFMAKKVITAQGGAIIFRSTEGKGSTFGFSFPRAKVEVKEPYTPKTPDHELIAAR